MALQAADITALAEQISKHQTAATTSQDKYVSVVSLKIPAFWSSRPEIWFSSTESQLATKNMSVNDTKYRLITALHKSVAAEISASFATHLQLISKRR